MAYTDQTKIADYLQRALTASEISYLTLLLPAIKIWIDRKTGSTFDEAQSTTRYYEGGESTIDIDPATDITAVSAIDNDGTNQYDYVLNTEYLLEPMNETVKREIVRRGMRFPSGSRRIAVTAKFSEYGAEGKVPEDIQLVATRIAADVLQSGKTSATGNVQSESLEGHSVSYRNPNEIIDKIGTEDPLILSILEQRKEIVIG